MRVRGPAQDTHLCRWLSLAMKKSLQLLFTHQPLASGAAGLSFLPANLLASWHIKELTVSAKQTQHSFLIPPPRFQC